ncbi:MAG: hypothetical protein HC892_08005 [Saprospiraceae bacterium]|nr:hypothetical protein [Saprospiraceae bacterium]
MLGDGSTNTITNTFKDLDYGIVLFNTIAVIHDAIFQDLRYAPGQQRVGFNTSIGIYADLGSLLFITQNRFERVYEGISISSSEFQILGNVLDTVNFGITIRRLLGFEKARTVSNTIRAAEIGIQYLNILRLPARKLKTTASKWTSNDSLTYPIQTQDQRCTAFMSIPTT